MFEILGLGFRLTLAYEQLILLRKVLIKQT